MTARLLPAFPPPSLILLRRAIARRLIVAMVGAVATVGTAAGATVDWAHGCQPFIVPAEHYYRLPHGLLQAIALTESGQDGVPYPWALNIGGQAVIAPTYQAAAQYLRLADGRPRRDVAIGCMQLHMQYHLASFTAPEWALHPRYNVWYAASYLDTLHARYGDWRSAVAHYHASDPAAQQDYLCRVGHYLVAGAPATSQALGLAGCPGGIPTNATRRHVVTRRDRARWSILAARRVGRIIVLGTGRGEP